MVSHVFGMRLLCPFQRVKLRGHEVDMMTSLRLCPRTRNMETEVRNVHFCDRAVWHEDRRRQTPTLTLTQHTDRRFQLVAKETSPVSTRCDFCVTTSFRALLPSSCLVKTSFLQHQTSCPSPPDGVEVVPVFRHKHQSHHSVQMDRGSRL